MDRVFATRTVKGIKSALASMPQKIDELYKLTLERIQQQAGDDGMLAIRILGWITHARRPLSVNELRHGLAVEYDDDEDNDLSVTELDNDNLLQPESLIDVCGGLVIIDSTSQIIRLVHYTTQEYFSNKRLDLFAGAEADISRACLTYLSYDIGHRFPDWKTVMWAFESHPFLHYAYGHWFSHVHSSLSAGTPASVFLDFVAHFKRSDSSLRSISLLRWDPRWDPRGVGSRSMLDSECPDRESALEVASSWGLEELVTVLLDHRTGTYPGLDRSLFFASRFGALNVVNQMLRYGAHVNFLVDDGVLGHADTALSAACEEGHLPVVKVLIKNGASPYVRDKPAMHAAALMNKPVVVDFLIKEGVNVSARDSHEQTALHMAAPGNSVVVKLLLDAHCDLNLKDNNGRTALHCAASNSSVDVVNLLLDAQCDPDLKDNNGWTALHCAALIGHVDVVKLLLDAHCDLNLKDNDGCTALRDAAREGNVGVVKLLLDAHCDLDLKDNDEYTTLRDAAREGTVAVVKLWLDAHCDPHLRQLKGRTEFRRATVNGNVNAVKLLLHVHCDRDSKDEWGVTALHFAARVGSVDVVNLLLDFGCDLDLKDDFGWTALHYAAGSHAVDIIELLFDRGADVFAKDKSGKTARNLLEHKLSSEDFALGGWYYESGKRGIVEQMLQRMIQMEQTASTASVDGA